MCHARRHSVFCILPPHILRSIATHGTASQRAVATRTLATDGTFRSLRASPLVTAAPHALAAPVPMQKHRRIFSAGGVQNLPGALVRTEGTEDTGDAAVDEAYAGLGATWDFYADAFQRNSIDDEGLGLDATVHFGQHYDNAFWNGTQMVFGDGDGQLFTRFTIAVDVIGHELTHGVTEDEAGLVYLFQPGALNESVSDVFGSLIKQKTLNQTAEDADWLIGAGLFAPEVHGLALRSMRDPGSAYDDPVLGRDPQPNHMSGFVHTYDDNGGVHVNSGIPNRAFYLTAHALGGYAWTKAGRIWYETLRDSGLRPNTGFKRFARLTVDVAGRLYGAASLEQSAVADAWRTVGVDVTVPSHAAIG